MMKRLWLDNRASTEFGLAITGAGTYDAPERDLEMIAIEGRNGDLVIDKGRYKNITIEYPASIYRGFTNYAQPLREWLYGSGGYRRLEDDYNPDTFRMGIYKGPLNFDVKALNRAAELTLRFECKPQRWLKSGEIPFRVETPYSENESWCYNATPFTALPLITVMGSGSGTLKWLDENKNERTAEILEMENGITLDSETMNAYWGDANKNNCIKAPVFPAIGPAGTCFDWTGDITGLEITPRWWTL